MPPPPPPHAPFDLDPLAGRCGSCARFVRVIEKVDDNGEVRRAGECLLAIWPSPLYETNTCVKYVQRGTFTQKPTRPEPRSRGERPRARPPGIGMRSGHAGDTISEREPISIPEELLDMDADEFRQVLREVIRDELGVGDVELGGRWQGGEMILKPGKEGTAEKRIPIESLFHKVVMIRDKLRILEQKVNGHAALSDEDKVQMQQYITAAYGSLRTFNVLFAKGDAGFVGQKGAKDD